MGLVHSAIFFDRSIGCLLWIMEACWRNHMEMLSALPAPCEGNPRVIGRFPHKGQWRGPLMFSLMFSRVLRRHRAHYDITVMIIQFVLTVSHYISICDSSCPGVAWFSAHVEAETKWTPFSRRYLQMHFLEWKCLKFDQNSTEDCF